MCVSAHTFKYTYLQVVLCKLFRQFFLHLKNVFDFEANGILDDAFFKKTFSKKCVV